MPQEEKQNKNSLSITDHRTGQTYALPVENGTIREWICAKSKLGLTILA